MQNQKKNYTKQYKEINGMWIGPTPKFDFLKFKLILI